MPEVRNFGIIPAFKLIESYVRFIPIVTLSLLHAINCATAQSTAVVEQSWQTYDQLPADEKVGIAPYCPGGFVAQPLNNPPEGTTLFHFDKADAQANQNAQFTGNVSFRTQDLEGTADVINYAVDEPSTLSGSVILRAPNLSFGGTDAVVDLQSFYAQISQAEFVLADRDMHGKARALIRETETDFEAQQIRFTRCQPNDAAWHLSASRLQIDTEEQVAKAWHSRLEVQDVPVFYLPYISFPLDDRPRTGLLIPTFSNGYFQDYYLNLAPNYDATLGVNLVNNASTQGEDRDNGFSIYSSTNTRFLTPSHQGEADILFNVGDAVSGDLSRWSVAHSQSGRLANAVNYEFGTRWVSDRFIDVDLTPGSNSLRETQQASLALSTSVAGVALNSANMYTQPVSDSAESFQTFSTTNTASIDGLTASALVETATIFNDRNPAASDYELLKQPELILTTKPKSIFGLNTTQQLSFTQASRNLPDSETQALTGDDQSLATNVDRYTAQFSVDRSWAISGIEITPSFETFYRQFDLDNAINTTLTNEDSDLLTWRFSTQLQSSWKVPTAAGNLHTFSPLAFYVYAPFEEQTSPIIDSDVIDTFSLTAKNRFTGLDRIGDMNRLSAGLNYNYQPKNFNFSALTGSIQKSVSLSQERVGLTSTAVEDDQYTPEFSPWYLSTSLRPDPYWTITAAADISHEADNVDTYRFSANVRPSEKVFASASLAKTSDTTQLQGGAYWPIKQNMALIAFTEFESPSATDNFSDLRRKQSLLGIDIDSCCWNIRFAILETAAAEDEDGDAFFLENSTFVPYFEFTLKGIGAGAGTIETMLNRLDFGYAGRLFNSQ